MEFKMGTGGIPVGSYQCEFIGAEDFNSQNANETFGPAITLKWKVLAGQYVGEITTRVVSKRMTPRSNLGKFAVLFKGGPIAPGEVFRLQDYVGTRGHVLVEPTDSGGTRVATFIREAAAQPQASPPPAPQPPPAAPPQPEAKAEEPFDVF